jgi:sugar/nucleoside kinase (ribokinase family)
VELADSLGAGDAFSAGFIHKTLRDSTLTDACQFGNVLGAIVATQVGATGDIPEGAVENFINKQYERKVYSKLKSYIS